MRASYKKIATEVAEQNNMTVRALLGTRKFRNIVHARQECMFRVFTECPHLSFPEIGRRLSEFGDRPSPFDHTTVLYAVRQHCERLGINYSSARAVRERRRASDRGKLSECSVIMMTDSGNVILPFSKAIEFIAPMYDDAMRATHG